MIYTGADGRPASSAFNIRLQIRVCIYLISGVTIVYIFILTFTFFFFFAGSPLFHGASCTESHSLLTTVPINGERKGNAGTDQKIPLFPGMA